MLNVIPITPRRAKCPGCEACRNLPDRVSYRHPKPGKRPAAKPYRVQVNTKDGYVETYHATRSEAKIAAAQTYGETARAKTTGGQRHSSWTVADYIQDRYFVAKIEWARGTRRKRQMQLDAYIGPSKKANPDTWQQRRRSALADMQVSKVDTLDVANFLRWLSLQHGTQTDKPLAYKSIDGVYSLLQGAFSFAFKDGVRAAPLLMPDMLAVADDGRRLAETEEVVPPTVEDMDRIRAWLMADPSGRRFAPMFELARWTGMRMGEIRALRWSRVTRLPDGRVRLRIDATAPDRFRDLVAPKSRKSNRRIILKPQAVAVLDALEQRGEYVFQGPTGHWSTDIIAKTLRAAADALGINARRLAEGAERLTPHDFRHWFITDRFAKGKTTAQVSDYVGCTEKVLERTYRHDLGDAAIADDEPGAAEI